MIEPVAPAKAVELPAALLEERHHRLQRLQRLDAVAGIIAPPRIRPARIARLAPGAEADQLGAPLRPAGAAQRDVEREQDFVEGGHGKNPVLFSSPSPEGGGSARMREAQCETGWGESLSL